MRIGRYEIIGTLGSGGMSQVSLARSTATDELVVLKRQFDDRDDPALMDEARVGLRLNHPNIVETLDFFHHEGRPVLVTAYVSGASLADLRAHGALPPDVILQIGRDIASALAFIHEAREEDGTPLEILHRDVTPSNILVGHDGIPRLIDLGIARSRVTQRERTQTGFMRGTLRYLAPELLQGESYSVSTDLWGLGMTLWEGALGRYALRGTDPAIFAQLLGGHVLGLDEGDVVDPRIAATVGALLTLDPTHRPRTARDVVEIFDAYIDPHVDAIARCASLVHQGSGPQSHYDEDAGIEVARLLVNRAAAAYGGPHGDWRIASEVAARLTRRTPRPTARELEAPLSVDDDDAPVGEVTEIIDAASLHRRVPTRGAVPAPLDLPSLDLPPAALSEDEVASFEHSQSGAPIPSTPNPAAEAPFEAVTTGEIVDQYRASEEEAFLLGEPTDAAQKTEILNLDRARLLAGAAARVPTGLILEDEDPPAPEWLVAPTLNDDDEQSVTDPENPRAPSRTRER